MHFEQPTNSKSELSSQYLFGHHIAVGVVLRVYKTDRNIVEGFYAHLLDSAVSLTTKIRLRKEHAINNQASSSDHWKLKKLNFKISERDISSSLDANIPANLPRRSKKRFGYKPSAHLSRVVRNASKSVTDNFLVSY